MPDSLDALVNSFPKRNEGQACVIYGNGLSLLPYQEIGSLIVQSSDRKKALEKQWTSLENKIRVPSLNLFSSKKKASLALGNLFLSILAKEKILNPLITTNWDAFFDSAACFLNLDYRQNPCLESASEELAWFGYKRKVVTNMETTRLWKAHGDIRYVWLSCCETLIPLNAFSLPNKIRSFYPQEELLHLDCRNQGKTLLQHHILVPYPSPTMQEKFKNEIGAAKKEIENAEKMIIIVGFSGWDYEEIVDPIINKIGKIPIFYISRRDWAEEESKGNDTPKLWRALKDTPNSVIIGDGPAILLKLLKSSGCFEKYKTILKKYGRKFD